MRRIRAWREDSAGVALVEFSLVLPVFLLLFTGLLEFAMVESVRNTANFASRDASMLAAEGGSRAGTDCIVLQSIEANLKSPATPPRIVQVDIFWSDVNGNVVGSAYNRYVRSGSTTCGFGDGSAVTVPYTLTVAGYPESDRCDVLAGCGGSHTVLDTIGVQVVYEHAWVTVFPRITAGSGVTLKATTAMRMEPQA